MLKIVQARCEAERVSPWDPVSGALWFGLRGPLLSLWKFTHIIEGCSTRGGGKKAKESGKRVRQGRRGRTREKGQGRKLTEGWVITETEEGGGG